MRDVWIADGRIVAPPDSTEVKPVRTIDARGLVVMPGGVDIHCHIAGSKPNAARLMTPEQKRGAARVLPRSGCTRSGALGAVPTTFATGYKYAGLGYTTEQVTSLDPGSIPACAVYIALKRYSSLRPKLSLKLFAFTKQRPVLSPRNQLLPICLPTIAREFSRL